MQIEEKIEKYISLENNININNLIKKFKVKPIEYQMVVDCLYNLEKNGKIIGDEFGNYKLITKDFYLTRGIVKKSSKNNFYINLGHGKMIIIQNPNEFNLQENETVYLESKNNTKFKNQYLGYIKRVVRKYNNYQISYLIRTKLLKDYNRNYFYVLEDDNKVYVPYKYLYYAYPNDEVTVEVNRSENYCFAKVKEIIKRDKCTHTFYKKNDNILNIYKKSCNLINNNYNELQDNDKFIAEIDNSNNIKFIKKIENEIVNNKIGILAYENGYDLEFSDEILKEANNLNFSIDENEYKNREDLRYINTFTIDGDDAKDLDDAVSIKKENNTYTLYVSIADVSYYVKQDTKLFNNALNRGTSIYPAGYVIPMLPEVLSNDLCSLNENEDKLTKTVIIKIDEFGNILDYNIVKSVIRSNKRMTYDKVESVFNNTCNDISYLKYKEDLILMDELSDILQQRRIDRGYISFPIEEMIYKVDEDENIKIDKRKRGKAQILIENFMVLANECVANYASNLQIPFIYRIDEEPIKERIEKLKQIDCLKKYIKTINNIKNPKLFQKVIQALIKDKSDEENNMLCKLILKCFSRAEYSLYNQGHFGLALDSYATFTSPIRRFPDLVNHMIIGEILDGNILDVFSQEKNIEMYALESTKKQYEADSFINMLNNILYKDYITMLIDETLEAEVMLIIDNKIHVKTNGHIYGIINYDQNCIVDNKIKINGENIKHGDKIYVTIESVMDNQEEVVFKYLGKDLNKIKKLTKEKRKL